MFALNVKTIGRRNEKVPCTMGENFCPIAKLYPKKTSNITIENFLYFEKSNPIAKGMKIAVFPKIEFKKGKRE
ncbi:hypothetical protein ULMA_07820 [Patiriisocius marinus]|uniref:Uncharacterized protein n=1 Tax=Patiriisocius marinus TaxID=1397112 RepID=A0A5J4IV40_9FLAO|nr:hypothetical protein ULMA_07820 [Patiriisocius marinus]